MNISLSEQKQNIITFFLFVVGLFTVIIVDSRFLGTNAAVKWIGISIAVLVLGPYFYIRNLKADAKIVRIEVSWSVLFFVISLFGSWIMSADPRQGIARVSWILTYILFFHIMVDLFDAGLNKKIAFQALLFVSGSALLLALLETYANYYLWWQSVGSISILPPYAYRFISIIGHSNSLMGFVNILAPMTVFSFINTKNIREKIPYAIWLVCYFFAIPFSSSRGGWLGVIVWVAILVFYWLWRKEPIQWWKRLDSKKRFIIVVVLFFCLILALIIGYRLFLQFAFHPSHGVSIFGGREEIWRNALQVWKDNFWFGAGPGRVGFATLLVNKSVPPGFWALHAHSVPIQVLAEFGLVGAIALLTFLFEISKWIISRFRLMNKEQMQTGMMILFGLIAWIVQMFVDDQTAVVSVVFTVLILLAMLVTLPDTEISRWYQIKNSILMIPAGILLLGAIGIMAAYQPFVYALDYFEHGNYEKGAPLLEKSLSRDSNFTFYKTQAAYLYGFAGNETTNDAYFIAAHNQFQNSLNIEPEVSVFYANLAIINWQTTQYHESSISNMQKAIDLSPKEASYYLNMGWLYEKSEKDIQALLAYQQALDLQPEWYSHPFWELSDVRKDALLKWVEDNIIEVEKNETYWEQAKKSIDLGSYDEAETLLAKAAWVGESEIAINITRGKLAEARGDTRSWLQYYEAVARAINPRKFSSPHQFMMTYTVWMNNRKGYTDDFVPGYLSMQTDVGQFEAVKELYAYYDSIGDCENAGRVWISYQTAMHGNALEPYNDMPICTE